MAIFTLTSDWRKNDFYVGAVKGEILSKCPDAKIVDISHQIHLFDIAQAAYVIQNTYVHFPPDTIHLIFVACESASNKYIAVKADGHYFLLADNGLLGLMFEEKEIQSIVEINLFPRGSNLCKTFPELSILTPAACYISNHNKITGLGQKTKKINRQIPLRAVIEDSIISARVIYIDSYGNVITNVTRNLFERICKDRPFRITVKNKHNEVSLINQTYKETPVGELLALFNSSDLLEIAICDGNAADLLDIDTDTYVRILFIEDENYNNES